MPSMLELIEESRRLGSNPSGRTLSPQLRAISENQFQETYGVNPSSLRSMQGIGGSEGMSEPRRMTTSAVARNFGETGRTRPEQAQIHPDAMKVLTAIMRAVSGPGSRTPGARLESAGRPMRARSSNIFDVRPGAQRTREAMAQPGAGSRMSAIGDFFRENMSGGVSEAADTQARGIFENPAAQTRRALESPGAGTRMGQAGDFISELLESIVNRARYGQ